MGPREGGTKRPPPGSSEGSRGVARGRSRREASREHRARACTCAACPPCGLRCSRDHPSVRHRTGPACQRVMGPGSPTGSGVSGEDQTAADLRRSGWPVGSRHVTRARVTAAVSQRIESSTLVRTGATQLLALRPWQTVGAGSGSLLFMWFLHVRKYTVPAKLSV